MNYDVLTVGSAIVDAILDIDTTSTLIQLKKEEKELRIKAGQKIPVESSGIFPGGNACNVAVGLSRAGLQTALVALIAKDEFADHITNTLKNEGVGLDYISKHDGSTVLNVALNFKGERTLFTHHIEQKHDFHFEKAMARALYVTSLGKEWKHVYKSAAVYVQHHGAMLAFNPGSTQLHEGIGSFSFLLPLTTILFVNKEEAEIMVGQKGSVSHLLARLKDLGPKVVSITNGKLGAYVIDERGSIYQKDAIDCQVVEPTGAGDAYATGFLAAYLHGHNAEQAMDWGLHNSASVIGHRGAQTGLLTKKELMMK